MALCAATTDLINSTQAFSAAKSSVFAVAADAKQQRAQGLHRKNHFTPQTYDLEAAAIRRACKKGKAIKEGLVAWYHRMSLWGARRMTADIPDAIARELWFNNGPDHLASVECFRLRRNDLLDVAFVQRIKTDGGMGLRLSTLEQRCDNQGEYGAWTRHKERRQRAKNDSAKRLRAERRAAVSDAKNTTFMVSHRVKGTTGCIRDPVSGRWSKTQTQLKDYKSKAVQDSAAMTPALDPVAEAARLEALEIAAAFADAPFVDLCPSDVRKRYASGQLNHVPEAADAAGCGEEGPKMPVKDFQEDAEPEGLRNARREAQASLAASEEAITADRQDEAEAAAAMFGNLDIARKPLYALNAAGYARVGQMLEDHVTTLFRTGNRHDVHPAVLSRINDVNRLFDACYEPVARAADVKALMADHPHARGLYVAAALNLNVSRTFWRYEAERMAHDGSSRLKNSVAILFARVRARSEALRGS